MEESEKLKELEKKASELNDKSRTKDNQYNILQAKLRKQVQTPLKDEIKQHKSELMELKRQVRNKTKVVYDANPELQKLKKEKDELWEDCRVAWQDYHAQYELENQK
jgi:Skp family chaperone for outer membrane proteins